MGRAREGDREVGRWEREGEEEGGRGEGGREGEREPPLATPLFPSLAPSLPYSLAKSNVSGADGDWDTNPSWYPSDASIPASERRQQASPASERRQRLRRALTATDTGGRGER